MTLKQRLEALQKKIEEQKAINPTFCSILKQKYKKLEQEYLAKRNKSYKATV